MQKSMFIQAEFGNQVIRDTKYNTTVRRVVNGIQGQNQNQKSEKQTMARQKSESKTKGVVYNITLNWLTLNRHRIRSTF